MNGKGPFRRWLPFNLALTVVVSGLVTLWIHFAYDFSMVKTLVAWAGTVIFCGLIIIGTTFLGDELDRREKEFYQRTGHKKTE